MFVRLTRVFREMTDEAASRLEEFGEEAASRVTGEIRDENGYTVEDYNNMGIPVPNSLLEKSNLEDTIEFDPEEDFITIESKILLNSEKIEYFDYDDEAEVTIVNFTSNKIITVKENLNNIEQLIKNE